MKNNGNDGLLIRKIMGNSIRVVNELLDLKGRPDDAELNTHLRVMYEYADLGDMIIELTPDTIRLLKLNEGNITVGKDVLNKMEVGDHVALLKADNMGPLTYKEMITGSVDMELMDLDTAIERASFWFVEDLLETNLKFTLFTPYFLVAFRLAVMDGDLSDEERYNSQRLSNVWHKTLSSVMFFIGQKLQQESIDIAKSGHCLNYNLADYHVEEYLDAIKS